MESVQQDAISRCGHLEQHEILGHVKYGQGQQAVELFQQMQQEGVQPDSVSFVGVLNACASVVAIEEGQVSS